MKNSNKPANPTVYMDQTNGSGEMYCDNDGLTKREHFAGLAMQGLLANSGGPIQHSPMCGFDFCNCGPDDVASLSVLLADALLAELEKEVKQ